ncbi:MAG: RpiB/LacA/LacB family sugar-phosphate isomerase [Oscillospiraceae bacterium]
MLKSNRIVLGSDKSGFELKQEIKLWLENKDIEVSDVGTVDIEHFQPFFEVAPKVARLVASGKFEKGILICGTGMGMCIFANKFKGVYAAAVESEYSAESAAIINDANVLTMGGWVVTPTIAFRMLEQWLGCGFTDGIPQERIPILNNAKSTLKSIEEENFK